MALSAVASCCGRVAVGVALVAPPAVVEPEPALAVAADVAVAAASVGDAQVAAAAEEPVDVASMNALVVVDVAASAE